MTGAARSMLAGLLGIISACTSLAPDPGDLPGASPAAFQDWELRGRLALRVGERGDSGSLQWAQQGRDLRVEMSGPVGINEVILLREGDVTRVFAEGQWQELDTGTAMLEQQLGWPLPLDSLSWWLRGLPAPGESRAAHARGPTTASGLHQAGWSIEFPEWQTVAQHRLPRRITLRRGDVEARVLIKEWVVRR